MLRKPPISDSMVRNALFREQLAKEESLGIYRPLVPTLTAILAQLKRETEPYLPKSRRKPALNPAYK